MELSGNEKLLIQGLQICGISKGMSAVIFMTLQTDEQKLEMCNYLADHKDASDEELLEQARRIAGTT